MSQGQFQAFLDPKDRPGGAVGGGAAMSGVSSVANEFMMAAAVSEYRSKQQLAQNLAASIAIKQDPGAAAAADADAQQQQHPHHPQPVVGPFQNVCFNEPHGWDWNGYTHPNHNFHPIHHHHQNEQLILPDHASQLAPLPANSGGSSTNNNNSSGNSSPQNNGGTDSPPVAAAANLQHPVVVPNLPQQPLQPEALLAAGPPPPPSHAHHLYYDQQVHQQYQYFQQYHQHHHQQYPIHHHHHQPSLDQYGFQDQPSHLNQQQQPELPAAALCFPTPPTEAGDLSHPPPPATTSSSTAAAAATTLVKQEANVSPTGSCSGAKPKNWNNNRDTA